MVGTPEQEKYPVHSHNGPLQDCLQKSCTQVCCRSAAWGDSWWAGRWVHSPMGCTASPAGSLRKCSACQRNQTSWGGQSMLCTAYLHECLLTLPLYYEELLRIWSAHKAVTCAKHGNSILFLWNNISFSPKQIWSLMWLER